MKTAADRIHIDVHLTKSASEESLQLIKAGLAGSPPWISSRFFYDDTGSRLFEKITTLPEYYQTRTEFDLLQSVSSRIVQRTGATELVELGSGAARKTRALLDAMDQAGQLQRYVPFDINEMIVQRSATELCTLYPTLEVHGVVGKFRHHLDLIPEGSRRLFIFLGGTIGNFENDDAIEFLREVQDVMKPDDALLLGADLIKDKAVLEAAYNDSQGVTAEFNKNIWNVVNDLTQSTFNPLEFKHVAFYDHEAHRIEMWLEALKDIHVAVPAIQSSFSLKKEQAVRTEISTKYNRSLVQELLAASGLSMQNWYTDDQELFSLSVAKKTAP